jgi:hypothetical protein
MIDGRVLMPGTVLVTKSPPPASWKRFSEPDEPKQFITNPAPGVDPLDELRADYETLTGTAPDKRWGEKRLRDELELLSSGGE